LFGPGSVAEIGASDPTVPDFVKELGEPGTWAAVILARHMSPATEVDGDTLQQRTLDAARSHLRPILKPN
jgi:hypothetical protein